MCSPNNNKGMKSETVNANARNHDHERGLPRLGGKPASSKIVIAIFYFGRLASHSSISRDTSLKETGFIRKRSTPESNALN